VAATEPDLKLAAVVELFGGLPQELHARVTKMPPVLIFHGDKDDVVPVKEAYALRTCSRTRSASSRKRSSRLGHMFLGDNGKVNMLQCSAQQVR